MASNAATVAMANCFVCTETINGRNRRQVVCFSCGHDEGAPVQCSDCVERYLLQSFQDPKCMHCQTAWNRDFLYRNMPHGFQKKYDLHRCNVLEQRERCKFPATMPLVQLRKEVDTADQQAKEAKKLLEIARLNYNNAVQRKRQAATRFAAAQEAIVNDQPPVPTQVVAVATVAEQRTQSLENFGQHAGHHDGFIHDGQSDLHIASGASLQNEMIGIA